MGEGSQANLDFDCMGIQVKVGSGYTGIQLNVGSGCMGIQTNWDSGSISISVQAEVQLWSSSCQVLLSCCVQQIHLLLGGV